MPFLPYSRGRPGQGGSGVGSRTAAELQKGPERAGWGIAATALLSSTGGWAPAPSPCVLPPTAVPSIVRPSFGMAERSSAETIAPDHRGQDRISDVPAACETALQAGRRVDAARGRSLVSPAFPTRC